MTQFKTIKGADEFLERIEQPLTDIKEDIKELNSAISKAQTEYNKVKDGYKLDDVQRKGELEIQLKNLREAKEKATERKNEIIDDHSSEVYTDARAMLRTHAHEMKQKHQEDIEKIEELRNEIETLIEKYNTANYEYAQEQIDFADAVNPYLATYVAEGDSEKLQRANLLRDVKDAFGRSKVLDKIEVGYINGQLGEKQVHI